MLHYNLIGGHRTLRCSPPIFILKGVFNMCKKVNFSISHEVDTFLTNTKNATGLPKSQVLNLMVLKYGDKIAKDLQKYARKEANGETVVSME